MSRTIRCTHCGREAAAMTESPLPGTEWETELLENTCEPCFGDWMSTEIMLINEYRLDLSNPDHREQLNLEMARFLRLPSAPAGEAAGPPPEATPPTES